MYEAAKPVSVVIPTKNDAPGLRRCLEALRRQTVRPAEILVIDSGSTDGTAEVARSFEGVRLVSIPPESFSHGGTRNLGAELAIGEFVLFTVQDAHAADESWIARLLDGFVAADVAGVCGTQVVAPDEQNNPVEWFRPRSTPQLEVIRFPDAAAFDALSPAEKMRVCGWDDVTAMYRRSALLEIGFRPVSFAEDLWFAVDALRAGYALTYNPAARAYHYHLENRSIAMKRTLLAALARYRAFGWISQEPALVMSFARAARILLREHQMPASRRVSWLKYNLTQLLAIRAAVRELARAIEAGPQAVDDLERACCASAATPLKAAT